MDVSILLDAGLSVNEARVYLALLELGSGSIIEISKKSKVHRVNVYDVIERLQVKGLISSIMKANKQFYEASNPEELVTLLESKKENLQNIMPELKLMYQHRQEKQQVHYFQGPEGVMTAYYMILDQNATLYGLGGSGFNRKILKHRHAIWDKERIKRKICVKALYYENSRKKKTKDNEALWEIKYLPNKFQNPAMVDICGDLVVILLPDIEQMEIMAIVIENKRIADGYKKYFDYMWEFAKD